MFALLNDEELKEAYGDYRHSQGLEEGADLVAAVVNRLVSGESRESIIESGISEAYIFKAEQLISLIKS